MKTELALGIIGNVPNNTSILLMNVENDSQTTVEHALLLEQKLNEVDPPDHTLITYPDLTHIPPFTVRGYNTWTS